MNNSVKVCLFFRKMHRPQCTQCRKTFQDGVCLILHQASIHGETKECPICHYSVPLNRIYSLRNHLLEDHGWAEIDIRIWYNGVLASKGIGFLEPVVSSWAPSFRQLCLPCAASHAIIFWPP